MSHKEVDQMATGTGRMYKENDATVNIADIMERVDVEIGNISDVIEDVESGIDGLQVPTTPVIYNVSLVTKDTEYSQALPANTKKISISIMGGAAADTYRLAFVTGKVATPVAPYLQLTQDKEFYEPDIKLAAATLYIASSADAKVAQIICWA